MEGVGECAVVGHPDPLRGQSVWAYVVMKEGFAFDEDKIRKHMVKNIASYKIPRRFIPLDALPKNATGKILKRALRDSWDIKYMYKHKKDGNSAFRTLPSFFMREMRKGLQNPLTPVFWNESYPYAFFPCAIISRLFLFLLFGIYYLFYMTYFI